MKPYTLHSQAAAEYAEAIEHYAEIDPELAGRFVAVVNGLIEAVACNPQRYPLWHPPTRRHFSDVFPYAVIYHDQPQRVWILAVMHMSRHPDYWKSRLAN